MFIKNCWYVAASLSELSNEAPIARTVIGEPLALYRTAGGDAVVFEDRCCHRWAALSRGRVEGDDLRCMYHGFKYDTSGACVEIPGQDKVPAGACVRRYPSETRYGWIWVWMGEPAMADVALIPSTPKALQFDTHYDTFSDQIGYAANYELINDNLTDFTHLSFVHATSFGASLEWAQTRPTITQLERGIRIERWILDDTITPRVLPEYVGRELRNWSSIDYLAPGVLLMAVEIFTPEAMAAVDGGVPTAEPLHSSYNWQAVTPVDETTSRYYFSWGVRREEQRGHMVPIFDHVIHSAFEEDRGMIENQQRIWSSTGKARMYGSSGDAGLNRMRQVMRRLRAAEAPAATTVPDTPEARTFVPIRAELHR